MRTIVDPPLDRPMMVFDGDCNFCRCWIERWRRATGERILYVEFQRAAPRFPGIPPEAFTEAVQLIEPNGEVASGADAVFHAFDFGPEKRRVLNFLRRIPGFMPIARVAYRFVARHRMVFSVLTRVWCRRSCDRVA